MKLSDFKTGMIVTLRNGDEYVVFKDISTLFTDEDAVICNGKSWERLGRYTNDMKHGFAGFGKTHDIVKVEVPYHPYSFFNLEHERGKRKIVWEEGAKEVTMAEIEEKFGCKVKIVKED